MTRLRMTNRSIFGRRGRKSRGFTLVELIVVLTIIAIIAAVGVVTIFGYIKKSRFEQNSQSAVSIYQAAQNALSDQVANGTHDSWTRKLVELKCSATEITAFEKDLDKNNESNTMKLSLTYNPHSPSGYEDSYLYNLLTSEFYDKSIFGGTIAVELDVVATYSKGTIYYSAWVASAFYCRQNDSETGWDSTCIGSAQDGLPERDYTYRRDTSLVGWFDGTADSVTGPDGVCPVHIPQSLINELDGHILADSTDSGYLVNLRNGETLDVSWAIFDTDGVLREAHNEKNLKFTLVSEGTDLGNAETYNNIELGISKHDLDNYRNRVKNQDVTIIHECVNSKTYITRYSRTALVDVTVSSGLSSKTMRFPLTVSKVIGDDRVGCPDPTVGYYEYRLSLDCMVIRSDESSPADTRLNGERLFGNIPRNISATFSGTFERYVEADKPVETKTVTDMKAARAIDDPVYFTGVSRVKGNTSYCYVVRSGMAKYDSPDNAEEGTTGKCVVNTLFGDLIYNDSVAGTSWTAQGGDAVITSFRHLYNIRWIENSNANYRIVRDLDWYTDKSDLLIVSDVKVFKCSNGECRTPATITNSNNADTALLKIVSFPAINELRAGQTLTSMSDASGKKYSINNLQMRTSSFSNNTDEGYGLICKNSGTISNIYTNNFNMVLSNVSDMSASDYSLISQSDATIGINSQSRLNANYYVGGLVGLNRGTIGNSAADDDQNVIMMSNPIVLSSSEEDDYWLSSNYPGAGGIIGKNESSAISGSLEINGRFAVVGNGNVGGVIAYSSADIGARLVVGGNPNGNSAFTLPVESTTGSDDNLSCVIAGTDHVGGAIGYLDSCSLTYSVSEVTVSSYDTDGTGRVEFSDHDSDDYQIYVDLPEESLILELDNGKDGVNVGGAIGYMNNCDGDYMSVYVNNAGNILIRNTNSKLNEVGGAIGYDYGSTVAKSFLTVINGNGAIGSLLDDNNNPLNKAECTGGVYGHIENVSDRTIYLDVENNGTKISAISDDSASNHGAGGAIGVIKDGKVNLVTNIFNGENTKIVYYSNKYSERITGAGGAIGAICAAQNNDQSYLTENSHVFVENRGYIYANYNAGGAVGVLFANYGGIYAYNNGAKIKGKYCIGGAVGWSKGAEYGEIQSTLSGATVDGINFIGGSVGRNPNLQGGTIITKVNGDSTVSGTGSVVGGVCGDVRVQGDGTGTIELDGNGSTLTVHADGKGVGGVAGVLRAGGIVNRATVNAAGVVLDVSGTESVGGAIGRLRSTSWENSKSADVDTEKLVAGSDNKTGDNIMVNVDVVLPHPSRIVGSDANVGGAIGFIHTNNGVFGGSISVTTESGSSEDSAIISGTYNVGGAIGHFGSCYPDWVADNSKIAVDFTDSPINIESTVSAGDNANLGGAVGFFDSDDKGNTNCQYVIVSDLGASSLTAKGSNVGGAIGYNKIHNGHISASSSGTITGNNNVAGGIGYNACQVASVTTDIGGNGSAEIYGTGNYVGGAVGYNLRKIAEVTVELTGESKIYGGYFEDDTLINGDCIGGALGYSEGELPSVTVNISGDSYVDGGINVGGAIGHQGSNTKWDLVISSIDVTINNDKVVRGYSNLGGAIGLLGSSSSPKALTINNVSVVMNTGNPIWQGAKQYPDACIGGVIGFHFKGTINSISLSGTGGQIDTLSANRSSGAPYRTYDNGLLITGHGNYLGGIIGKSGDTGSSQSSSKVINISATGPSICVVSTNGSSYIGGWIGACYSFFSGGTAQTKTTYDVNTVKVVYSNGDYVGGVCGKLTRTAAFDIYMNMTVELSEAIVSGKAAVGGAFGEFSAAKLTGRLDVSLENATRIGDYQGSLSTVYGVDTVTDGCICVQAGGAIGVYKVGNGQNTSAYISVRIGNEDQTDTSMVFAGGDDLSNTDVDLRDNSGVGGAVGILTSNSGTQNYGNKDCSTNFGAYFYVLSYSSNVAVYSKATDVGGFAGCTYSVNLQGCFSTAVVRGDGEDADVGGFAGCVYSGKINNCYSGGHTVGGQYIPLYENVTGKKNVGGFAGFISNSATQIVQCYSTCSVNGEDCVGGFVGSTDANKGSFFQECYCTGYVFINSESSTNFGSFAGCATKDNVAIFNISKVVDKINAELPRVGNIPESRIGVNQIRRAMWNGAGNEYIKKDATSIYHANPFDSTLKNEDGTVPEFPLRTFISVQLSTPERPAKHWEGVHYGDWPIIPTEDPDYILINPDVEILTPINVYNGTAVEPVVKVTKGGKELTLGVDYTVVYWRNNKIGMAAAIVVGIGQYYGQVKEYFEITSPDINSTEFEIKVDSPIPFNDDGTEVKPPVSVIYKKDGKETPLVENQDYTLVYESNTQPGQGKVKITGMGNYTGEVVKEFTILPLYTVNFEAGGETVYVPQRIAKGNVVERPADPKLTGHLFVDWYKDAELTEKYNFADQVDGDLTIYAKWTKEQYTVEFVVNGGVPVDPQTVEYNDILDASKINEQIKTDCTFVGWYSDEECTQEFTLDTPVTGAMTLYALWKDNPLVTYNGTDIPSERIEYNSCITKPDDPAKEHFTFIGWYKDAEFETEYDFAEPVTADIEIYAKWVAKPVVIVHIDTGKTTETEVDYEYDLSSFEIAEPTKDGGYRFGGWYADEECTEAFDFEQTVTADVHIYAKWIKTYIITVHLGEGEPIEITVDEGDIFSYLPEKDDFVFDGWFTDGEFTNPITMNFGINGNYTVYAKWATAHYVTIVISEGNEVVIPVAEGKRLEYTPEREGYTFLGYYEDDQFTTPIEISTIDIYSDYRIYALWEEET